MWELMRNAWLGWQNFTDHGKLPALLLAALLFLWFGCSEKGKSTGAKRQDSRFVFLLYTCAMVICCICPLTAAVLMKYQTRFYDYQWVWSAVPMTVTIALAGTLFWTGLTEQPAKRKGGGWKIVGITLLSLSVIYLCGPMGDETWQPDAEADKREETAKVLEVLTENGQNRDIMLWAPQSIMEYTRALDGHVLLPYGRNMWDKSLGAYSYDTYGRTERMLYQWMKNAEETGEGVSLFSDQEDGEAAREREIRTSECMELARELGVNCILLPETIQPETLKEAEKTLGAQAEKLEGYYLLALEKE